MLQFVFSDVEEECNWITFVILKEQIQAKIKCLKENEDKYDPMGIKLPEVSFILR